MISVFEYPHHISNLILSISEMSSILDDNINKHNYRVAFTSYLLAKHLKPEDREFIKRTLTAGIFHDIGVLAMRNTSKVAKVLFGYSDEEENEIIRCHCEIGFQILKNSILKSEAEIVRYHHEPYSPDKEGKVLFESFIIRFADRVDMLIKRYVKEDLKKEYPVIEEKLKEILKDRRDFHPKVVDTFFRHISPKEAFWFYYADEETMKGILSEAITEYSQAVGCSEFFNLVQMLAHIVDFKSSFTFSHSYGVARVARELSKILGFSKIGQKRMELAGLLHDIGKIKIPTEILEKPGKLTEEEFNLMKSHVFYTYQILSKLSINTEVIEWAAFHHETLDGNGYPMKLKEEDLSVGSRVMAVADIFTALREKRPYRTQMPLDEVLKILKLNAKKNKIDGKIVRVLVNNVSGVDKARCEAQIEAENLYKKLFCNVGSKFDVTECT